jgi:uncharacterized protein (DUF952 family)
MIYHIVIEPDFRARLEGSAYLPANLHDAGFVHCAFKPAVLAVANDYYAGAAGRLLLLQIDSARLTSETRCEAAAFHRELPHDNWQVGLRSQGFKCADVTVRSLGAADAALVEAVDRWRCANGVVPPVDRGAARVERHRVGRAAMVL